MIIGGYEIRPTIYIVDKYKHPIPLLLRLIAKHPHKKLSDYETAYVYVIQSEKSIYCSYKTYKKLKENHK